VANRALLANRPPAVRGGQRAPPTNALCGHFRKPEFRLNYPISAEMSIFCELRGFLANSGHSNNLNSCRTQNAAFIVAKEHLMPVVFAGIITPMVLGTGPGVRDTRVHPESSCTRLMRYPLPLRLPPRRLAQIVEPPWSAWREEDLIFTEQPRSSAVGTQRMLSRNQ
jgi:hypothetical protein